MVDRGREIVLPVEIRRQVVARGGVADDRLRIGAQGRHRRVLLGAQGHPDLGRAGGDAEGGLAHGQMGDGDQPEIGVGLMAFRQGQKGGQDLGHGAGRGARLFGFGCVRGRTRQPHPHAHRGATHRAGMQHGAPLGEAGEVVDGEAVIEIGQSGIGQHGGGTGAVFLGRLEQQPDRAALRALARQQPGKADKPGHMPLVPAQMGHAFGR